MDKELKVAQLMSRVEKRKSIKVSVTFAVMTFIMMVIGPICGYGETDQGPPIARVYDQSIYEADILPHDRYAENQRSKLSPEEYRRWEDDYKRKRLSQRIYAVLQDHFLKEEHMEPTEEDIHLQMDTMREIQATELERLQSQREELVLQLKAEDLKDAQRQSLTEHLKTVDQLIEGRRRREEEGKSIPNYAEIKEKSLHNVAGTTVTAWKYNKALYERYGGRVIFQQFGWEPIDAYKAFLDEHKEKQTYAILDSAYTGIFDQMYKYFEMGHSYMSKEEADKYFERPWWDPDFDKAYFQ